MKFHSVLRNVQLCGNFFIAQSFAHQPQDLVFTRCQGFRQFRQAVSIRGLVLRKQVS